MKQLAKIPFGSRLYGTNDENSDHDWKILYLPALDELLIGTHLKNQFKSSSSDTVKNTSEDTDTELIPVQTFATDLLNGQTYALEMAFAILQRSKIPALEVYDLRLLSFVEKLVDKFLTSNINKMVGYAYNQAQLYSEKGDRLDLLHKFKQLLEELTTTGYVTGEDKLALVLTLPKFDELAKGSDTMLYVATNKAPDHSEHKGVSVLGKFYPDTISIDEAKKRLEININKYGRRANESMINQGKDWKAISHAVRITKEAGQLLTTSWIELPFNDTDVDLLKRIKYGRVEWSEVQKMLIDNIDQLTTLQQESHLPIKTESMHQQFLDWLKIEMINLYGVSNAGHKCCH